MHICMYACKYIVQLHKWILCGQASMQLCFSHISVVADYFVIVIINPPSVDYLVSNIIIAP